MVYDNLLDMKLYCVVGNVNKESNTREWGEGSHYDVGKQSRVALILYALEIHQSALFVTGLFLLLVIVGLVGLAEWLSGGKERYV